MNKVVAYYSLIVIAFCALMCIFDSEGDEATFIGGLMVIPVVYSLWEMITECKVTEAEKKQRDEIRKTEEMREEIKKELAS